MNRLARRIRHRIELAGVRLLAALPRVLPLKISIKLGGTLGLFAFDVVRVRRRVTLENLDRAFGEDRTAAEKVRIGRASYVNFAKSIIEFASLSRLGKEDYAAIVRFENIEHLREPLSRGHGVIAVTGHFGSWELLGGAVAASGIPVDFLVGEQQNSLVNDLMNDLRRSAGIGIIERGAAARGVFDSLRRKRVVALLADQDARQAGVFVDFLGSPASTFQGPAQFACRTGSPLVSCIIVRRSDETHDAVLFPPVYPDAGADREAEVLRLTQAHAKTLEDCVRRHPEQYFWAHRRWKTKPPVTPSISSPDSGR